MKLSFTPFVPSDTRPLDRDGERPAAAGFAALIGAKGDEERRAGFAPSLHTSLWGEGLANGRPFWEAPARQVDAPVEAAEPVRAPLLAAPSFAAPLLAVVPVSASTASPPSRAAEPDSVSVSPLRSTDATKLPLPSAGPPSAADPLGRAAVLPIVRTQERERDGEPVASGRIGPVAVSPTTGVSTAPNPPQGDLAPVGVTPSALVRAVQGAEASGAPRRFDIVLRPEALGVVRVKVVVVNETVRVTLDAARENGLAALQSDRELLLPLLREIRGGDMPVQVTLQHTPPGATGAQSAETWSLRREPDAEGRERPSSDPRDERTGREGRDDPTPPDARDREQYL